MRVVREDLRARLEVGWRLRRGTAGGVVRHPAAAAALDGARLLAALGANRRRDLRRAAARATNGELMVGLDHSWPTAVLVMFEWNGSMCTPTRSRTPPSGPHLDSLEQIWQRFAPGAFELVVARTDREIPCSARCSARCKSRRASGSERWGCGCSPATGAARASRSIATMPDRARSQTDLVCPAAEAVLQDRPGLVARLQPAGCDPFVWRSDVGSGCRSNTADGQSCGGLAEILTRQGPQLVRSVHWRAATALRTRLPGKPWCCR